jgi:hypothetical protein
MDIWIKNYPKQISTCDYDLLTRDQITQTKELIDTLGLDWEDACLEPHKNERIIKTASQQQVREKVYKDSSQKWKKFAPFIGDKFRKLTNE